MRNVPVINSTKLFNNSARNSSITRTRKFSTGEKYRQVVRMQKNRQEEDEAKTRGKNSADGKNNPARIKQVTTKPDSLAQISLN